MYFIGRYTTNTTSAKDYQIDSVAYDRIRLGKTQYEMSFNFRKNLEYIHNFIQVIMK